MCGPSGSTGWFGEGGTFLAEAEAYDTVREVAEGKVEGLGSLA